MARGAPGSDRQLRGEPNHVPFRSRPRTPRSGGAAQRRIALNEDWAATISGLLLLGLVLTGLLPSWLVP
ncbi:MAG TPA: hypothetical protein VNA11_03875 [Pseudonocardia sp.]|nr:hypothetical protein [Pseudonocardia sp.]